MLLFAIIGQILYISNNGTCGSYVSKFTGKRSRNNDISSEVRQSMFTTFDTSIANLTIIYCIVIPIFTFGYGAIKCYNNATSV